MHPVENKILNYLLDKYEDFRVFVSRKTKDGFFITKDAGIFLCEK